MSLGTWLWILIFLTKQGLPVAGPSRQKQLTLHINRDTTWNHANRFCEFGAKKLVTMDNLDVVNAIKQFNSDGEIWDGELESFWIGLHDSNKNPDVAGYVWATCEPLGDFQPWKNSDNIDAKHCVLARKNLDYPDIWETTDCSSKDGFVMCEEQIGPCEFKHYGLKILETGVSGSPSTLLLGRISSSECESLCLSHYEDGEECWGYHIRCDKCVLYIGTTLAQVTDKMTGSTITSHVKSCYVGKVGSGIGTARYEGNQDRFPWSGCMYPIASASAITSTPSSIVSAPSIHTTSSRTGTTISTITTATFTKTREPTFISSAETTFITKLLTPRRNTTTYTVQEQPTSNDFAGGTSGKVLLASSTTDESEPVVKVSPETSSVQSTEVIATEHTSHQSIPRYVSGRTSWKPTRPTDGTLSFAAIHSKMTTALVIQTSEPSPTMDVTQTTGTITQSEKCLCHCVNLPKLTDKEKELLLDTILRNLTIDFRHISASRRKYISVDDPRPSAKTIGSAGIVMLSLTLFGVFVFDFGAIVRDVKVLYQDIRR